MPYSGVLKTNQYCLLEHFSPPQSLLPPPPTPHTRVMLMNFDFCSSKKILQSLKLQDNEENSPELLYSNTCDD